MSLTHGQNNSPESEFESYVVVVGAGPAGATTAYHIASAGLNVIVLDKQHFPREKICGDFVSPGAIKELQKMHVTDSPSFKKTNLIDRATIYLSGKELVAGSFPEVLDLPKFSRVIPRKVLDSLILESARNAGARVLEGYQVTDFQVDKEGVTVTANSSKVTQTFRASLLIGADGNNSIVARILRGSEWPKSERAIVARGYFEEVAGKPNEANVFYANDSFPGYSWLFPMGKHEANVGVGLVLGASPPAENPKDLLTKLISSDAGMRSRLEHAKLKGDIEVCPLNLRDPQMPIVGNRVMLVGEAAGLVNPYNGEGIQFGLLSGRWAAEAVVASKGDFSEQALSAYSKRIEDELGYGFKISELMLGLLRNRNLNQAWLRWIELMGQKSKTDPEYARLTSGILSGMIFPNQKDTAKALTGTLQEAALSVGVTTFTDILNDPSKLPQSAITITQTGLAVAQYAVQDPFGALTWGMDAAAKIAEIAATVPKQILKETESKVENQQQ
ncbi:MAG: geranylgeranyl reductase family protein [Chloroflexi bacterium]|nr:geranylgeranyl reductase family protein [Chloroflexota bacterium]